jgi:putative transposase
VRQDYSVARWAKFLDVSRSGFYTWKKDTVRRDASEAAYGEAVRKIFAEGEGTYGPERISGIMRKRGHKASFRKVRAHMEREGLRSIHCRRRSHSLTDSAKSRGEGFPNLTKGLEIISPFQVLTSDISYIRTGEGFEYLCQVKDVVSGVVLASSMMPRMKAELVERTVEKTFGRWLVPAGCIFHSLYRGIL